MRKNYIAAIDTHLSEFHLKGEEYARQIDVTISELEGVINTAQAEIVALNSFRNVVERMALPDYESPAMPKVSTLEQSKTEELNELEKVQDQLDSDLNIDVDDKTKVDDPEVKTA